MWVAEETAEANTRRGAAVGCSPGRKPWDTNVEHDTAPEGPANANAGPSGADFISIGFPGLPPWATPDGRSAA